MKPNKLDLNSMDGTRINLEALYKIAPSCFTEVKDEETGELRHVVNFTTLRQLLGDDAVEDTEMYQFTWPGKQEARLEAARPTDKTLRPVKEDSEDWDNTQNLYIEGDNLEVLKLLQKSYMGKIKMIYIDPPYNTGNEFVYDDDFKVSQDELDFETGDVDELGNRYRKNTDSNARFHSDWCSMIYPRLKIAHSLLSKNGIIFISIDDNEQKNLKYICDEIFGEKNFVTTIHCQLSTTQGMKVKAAKEGNVVKNAEYILCYSNNGHKNIAVQPLYDLRPEYDEHYSSFLKDDGTFVSIKDIYNYQYPKDLNNKKQLSLTEAFSMSLDFKDFVNKNLRNIVRMHSVTGMEEFNYVTKDHWIKINKNDRTYYLTKDSNDNIQQLLLLSDSWGPTDGFYNQAGLRKIRGDWWEGFFIDMGNVSKEGNMPFANGKKPIRLIFQLIKMVTGTDSSSEDIILDFFSGSATTAHAVLKMNAEFGGNRRYIMVQIPEKIDKTDTLYKSGFKNICEVGKERIRRSGKKIKNDNPLTTQNLDTGFRVFRVDSSNLKEVNLTPNQYTQGTLDGLSDNVKGERNDLDLLFGAMLSWGVQLSLPMSSEKVDGKMVYTVNEGDLVACFEQDITEGVIDAIAEKQPLRVLFRDRCFNRDDAKINIFETLKQKLDWSEEEALKNIRVI